MSLPLNIRYPIWACDKSGPVPIVACVPRAREHHVEILWGFDYIEEDTDTRSLTRIDLSDPLAIRSYASATRGFSPGWEPPQVCGLSVEKLAVSDMTLMVYCVDDLRMKQAHTVGEIFAYFPAI